MTAVDVFLLSPLVLLAGMLAAGGWRFGAYASGLLLETRAPVTGWACLELLGHRVVYGYLTEAHMFGRRWLKVAVPRSDGGEDIEYYSPASVYGMRGTTEEMVRANLGLGQTQRPIPAREHFGFQSADAEEIPF